MKFIRDIIVSAIVFVAVMLLFNIPFPVLRNSDFVGIFATVTIFTLIASVVSLAVVLIGFFGGLVVGAIATSDKDFAHISGCLGLIVGILIAYIFEYWFLVNAHSWNSLNWFPAFTGGQAFLILVFSLVASFLSGNGNKSEKKSS